MKKEKEFRQTYFPKLVEQVSDYLPSEKVAHLNSLLEQEDYDGITAYVSENVSKKDFLEVTVKNLGRIVNACDDDDIKVAAYNIMRDMVAESDVSDTAYRLTEILARKVENKKF